MATSTGAESPSPALSAYCQGFARAEQLWPALPLQPAPELSWWQELIGTAEAGVLRGLPLLRALEAVLPQLRLPQVNGISGSELYKQAVLRGEQLSPEELARAGPLPSWDQPESLELAIHPHPCGAMPVLQTSCWNDFVQLVRALAQRGEPFALADGVHAQAVSGLIHWGLIERLGRNSRGTLIVLHVAPYGSVEAWQVPASLSDDAWLHASTTLRLEHELTHIATKTLLGEMRLNLLDELIADCMGMVAAIGRFDAALFGRCLGIDTANDDLPIANGRWLSYTRELSASETLQAIALVMQRARELEAALLEQPRWLQSEQAMARLQWLCQQRIDQPITALPATPH